MLWDLLTYTFVKVGDLMTCLNVKFLSAILKYEGLIMAWCWQAETGSFLLPVIICVIDGKMSINGYILIWNTTGMNGLKLF
jgi:hypothetical protein